MVSGSGVSTHAGPPAILSPAAMVTKRPRSLDPVLQPGETILGSRGMKPPPKCICVTPCDAQAHPKPNRRVPYHTARLCSHRSKSVWSALTHSFAHPLAQDDTKTCTHAQILANAPCQRPCSDPCVGAHLRGEPMTGHGYTHLLNATRLNWIR